VTKEFRCIQNRKSNGMDIRCYEGLSLEEEKLANELSYHSESILRSDGTLDIHGTIYGVESLKRFAMSLQRGSIWYNPTKNILIPNSDTYIPRTVSHTNDVSKGNSSDGGSLASLKEDILFLIGSPGYSVWKALY